MAASCAAARRAAGRRGKAKGAVVERERGFLINLRREWPGRLARQPGLFEPAPPLPGSLPSLAAALAAVPEHRRPRGYNLDQPPYPLVPLLLLLVVGVLVRRAGYTAIAEWAASCAAEAPEVLDRLGFPGGRTPRTPAPSTLFRLARDLDLAALAGALHGWFAAIAARTGAALPLPERGGVPLDQVALDGKTVRGASARRADTGEAFLHLVAAYQPALRTVLDQAACAGKGQELAAVEVLLGRLPLKGRVLTGDALLTQRGVCAAIVAGGGDYLFPVKENQPALLADLEAAFSPPAAARPGRARAAGRGRAAGGAAHGAAGRAPGAGPDPAG
jgi:DDE family transposase